MEELLSEWDICINVPGFPHQIAPLRVLELPIFSTRWRQGSTMSRERHLRMKWILWIRDNQTTASGRILSFEDLHAKLVTAIRVKQGTGLNLRGVSTFFDTMPLNFKEYVERVGYEALHYQEIGEYEGPEEEEEEEQEAVVALHDVEMEDAGLGELADMAVEDLEIAGDAQ